MRWQAARGKNGKLDATLVICATRLDEDLKLSRKDRVQKGLDARVVFSGHACVLDADEQYFYLRKVACMRGYDA